VLLTANAPGGTARLRRLVRMLDFGTLRRVKRLHNHKGILGVWAGGDDRVLATVAVAWRLGFWEPWTEHEWASGRGPVGGSEWCIY
jgi:hypothetical protein